jgi:hypothetical protein
MHIIPMPCTKCPLLFEILFPHIDKQRCKEGVNELLLQRALQSDDFFAKIKIHYSFNR